MTTSQTGKQVGIRNRNIPRQYLHNLQSMLKHFVFVTVSITLIITITYFNSIQHVAEALYIPLHGVANLTLGRYLLLKQDIAKFNCRTIVNNIV